MGTVQEQGNSGSGTTAGQIPSRRLWQVLAGVWPAVMVALVAFYNLDISARVRNVILIGIVALIAVALLVALMWAKRHYPSVARMTTFLVLFTGVFMAALVPSVFLETSDRIIVLKLGAILFLSLLPGLLYLQFIALRRGTLRDEYVTNLHRLQIDTYENLPPPPRGSIWFRSGDDRPEYDPQNLYQRKFDATYGADIDTQDGRTITGWGSNVRPILLATILLAVGWALVLQPEPIAGTDFLGTTLSGRPILPTDALRFGFAGAYLFILEMLIRRYFQDDLKPSAYVSAAARVVTVILLVTAVHQVWPAQLSAAQENAFAFLIGVFPLVGLKALQNLIAKSLRGLIQTLRQDYPLSDLDGLNIWYESRLLEEGVEDMQNLATANLVDVMLRTRVPVDRLMDWVDQAVLFLRVSKKPPGGTDRNGNGLPSDRERLRRLGIRTATDLEDAFVHPVRYRPKGGLDEQQVPKPDDFDQRLLNVLNDPEDGSPSVTLAILRSLAREPNLSFVRHWKQYPRDLAIARRQRARPGAAARAAPHAVVETPAAAASVAGDGPGGMSGGPNQ